MTEQYPWRTGRSCVYRLHYHLVFVTKYRRDVLTNAILNDLKSVMVETCQQMGGECLEFNGEDDHIHIMVVIPPKISLSILIGKLKGKSAYVIRRKYWMEVKRKLWRRHFWSPSYCAVSCGGAPLEIVKKYIENQRRPTSAKSAMISQREHKRAHPKLMNSRPANPPLKERDCAG